MIDQSAIMIEDMIYSLVINLGWNQVLSSIINLDWKSTFNRLSSIFNPNDVSPTLRTYNANACPSNSMYIFNQNNLMWSKNSRSFSSPFQFNKPSPKGFYSPPTTRQNLKNVLIEPTYFVCSHAVAKFHKSTFLAFSQHSIGFSNLLTSTHDYKIFIVLCGPNKSVFQLPLHHWKFPPKPTPPRLLPSTFVSVHEVRLQYLLEPTATDF